MNRDTRRLVQLTVSGSDKTDQTHGYAAGQETLQRPAQWLETKGNLAEV